MSKTPPSTNSHPLSIFFSIFTIIDIENDPTPLLERTQNSKSTFHRSAASFPGNSSVSGQVGTEDVPAPTFTASYKLHLFPHNNYTLKWNIANGLLPNSVNISIQDVILRDAEHKDIHNAMPFVRDDDYTLKVNKRNRYVELLFHPRDVHSCLKFAPTCSSGSATASAPVDDWRQCYFYLLLDIKYCDAQHHYKEKTLEIPFKILDAQDPFRRGWSASSVSHESLAQQQHVHRKMIHGRTIDEAWYKNNAHSLSPVYGLWIYPNLQLAEVPEEIPHSLREELLPQLVGELHELLVQNMGMEGSTVHKISSQLQHAGAEGSSRSSSPSGVRTRASPSPPALQKTQRRSSTSKLQEFRDGDLTRTPSPLTTNVKRRKSTKRQRPSGSQKNRPNSPYLKRAHSSPVLEVPQEQGGSLSNSTRILGSTRQRKRSNNPRTNSSSHTFMQQSSIHNPETPTPAARIPSPASLDTSAHSPLTVNQGFHHEEVNTQGNLMQSPIEQRNKHVDVLMEMMQEMKKGRDMKRVSSESNIAHRSRPPSHSERHMKSATSLLSNQKQEKRSLRAFDNCGIRVQELQGNIPLLIENHDHYILLKIIKISDTNVSISGPFVGECTYKIKGKCAESSDSTIYASPSWPCGNFEVNITLDLSQGFLLKSPSQLETGSSQGVSWVKFERMTKNEVENVEL